jgi:hypothetical protein
VRSTNRSIWVVTAGCLGLTALWAESSRADDTEAPTTETPTAEAPTTETNGIPPASTLPQTHVTPPASAHESTNEAQRRLPSSQIKWRPLVLRSEVPPDKRPIFGSFEGTYLMVGPHVGVGLSSRSFLLGGEVSVVHQTTEFVWYGAFVDGVRDFGREQTRFSIGPEVGFSAFGLDAGYLLVSRGDSVAHGVTLRPMISLGYATLFGRFSKELSNQTRLSTELGLLLKYPIEL